MSGQTQPTGAPESTAQPQQKFIQRLLSFVVLWGIVIGAVFSPWPALARGLLLLLIGTISVLGLIEFYRLLERRGVCCYQRFGCVAGAVLTVGTFLHCTGKLGMYQTPARVNDFQAWLLVGIVLALCVWAMLRSNRTGLLIATGTTMFGIMYVPWLANFIQQVNFFPTIGDSGRYYVLYFLVVTKLSDTGAYLVGTWVGKHKLAPRLSPNKTWEGFFGGVALAVLASLIFAGLAGTHLHGMNYTHALVLGCLLGAGAAVGDLVESAFKREAGVKDSGRWFPGIGGVLDLMDSLLFNAPVMYLYLRHVLTR